MAGLPGRFHAPVALRPGIAVWMPSRPRGCMRCWMIWTDASPDVDRSRTGMTLRSTCGGFLAIGRVRSASTPCPSCARPSCRGALAQGIETRVLPHPLGAEPALSDSRDGRPHADRFCASPLHCPAMPGCPMRRWSGSSSPSGQPHDARTTRHLLWCLRSRLRAPCGSL